MFPLKHCFCVCIFWWFGSSPCAPALQLQLCHSHLVKEEYYIAPPSGCKRHNGTYIKTCTAEVFLPTNDFLHLSITTCEVFKTVSSTTFYFFGAETHSDRTIAGSPPSIQAYSEWQRTRETKCCGRLSQQNSATWASDNSPTLKYVWPTSHKETANNAVVTRTTAIYNHLRKQLISPVYSLTKCEIQKGFCRTGTKIHFWAVPRALNCPRVKKLKTVPNVSLHFTSSHSLYRAEVKELGITLHSQIQCPTSIFTCFPKQSICDPTGIILLPHKCKWLKGLHFKRLVQRIQTLDTTLRPQFARFLSENADLLQESFRHLDLSVDFLDCQIQNLFATVYSILSRQFPGQVLSLLLRRPVAAITIGDVLREIVCRPINATLLHSLQFGQHFSSRPLVHYINSQGNLTLGQIYPDGNAYPGVRFIETYIPGRVFTFNIANHFYTFQNYCLTHSRSKVYRLSPTLAPVDVHFDPPNYEEISSLFPTSDFGFEDITSILRTINDANLIHERLTSFLLDRPTAETSANPNYLLDTASSALKSIFMQLISSITNPILNGIVSFLFLLSLFWEAVLSVIALRSFIPGALLATRNRLAKTPNSEATTPV